MGYHGKAGAHVNVEVGKNTWVSQVPVEFTRWNSTVGELTRGVIYGKACPPKLHPGLSGATPPKGCATQRGFQKLINN